MFRRAAGFTVTLLLVNSLNIVAADRETTTNVPKTPISTAVARAAKDAEPTVNLWTLSQVPRRPVALGALYGTYATLQTLDLISTRKTLAAGGHEQNPLMKSGGIGSMIAMKAVAGASTIYFTEKLWKKHRVGAIVVMAALNGTSAAIVAHNNRIASRR
jgi:hypothetical protein